MFSSQQLEVIGIDFLHRIRVDSKTQCWEWLGSRLDSGYGQIFVVGKAINEFIECLLTYF